MQRYLDLWSAALAQGNAYEIEVRNRRHDDQYRWFLTRAVPARDAGGQITAWFGTTTDIHDKKRTEKALKQADRRKDEFLAMLAHELRNPMAPLRNAAKYTPPGGSIRVAASRQDDSALVSVRDNGIGIPAEHLPCVFEMFTQVDRSIERTQGGLGIGLTLVRRVVHLHGGSVEARSEGAGKGTEVIVRLPLLDEPSSGQARGPR